MPEPHLVIFVAMNLLAGALTGQVPSVQQGSHKSAEAYLRHVSILLTKSVSNWTASPFLFLCTELMSVAGSQGGRRGRGQGEATAPAANPKSPTGSLGLCFPCNSCQESE